MSSDKFVYLRGGLAVPEVVYRLLLDLEALGVRVRRDGEHLRVGPVSRLTPQHTAVLRTHKADVLRLVDYCTRADLDAHLFTDDAPPHRRPA